MCRRRPGAASSCRGHDSFREGPRARQRLHRDGAEGSPRHRFSRKAIERICDRNWGVGSDGILLLVPTGRADFGLRIVNPDGSEAEKSGNGLRIFVEVSLGPRPRATADLHYRHAGRRRHVPVPRRGRPRCASSRSRWAGRRSRRPAIPMRRGSARTVAVPLSSATASPCRDRGLGREPALRHLRRRARARRGVGGSVR